MDINSPTDCFYYLITRASLTATAILKRKLAEAGLEQVKPAYLGVLMTLWKNDGLHVAELGKLAGLEPSTMTGLVDRMERDTLITRHADPTDRRAQIIRLTSAGIKCEKRVMTLVTDTLAMVSAGIDEENLEQTKDILRKFLANAIALKSE